MKCPEVMELMQRYVDRDLDQAEEALLLAHVMQCPECADMLEKLQLLSDELESLPEVMPPFSIVDSILPQLERMADEQSAAKSIEPEQETILTAGERNALLGAPPDPKEIAAEKAIGNNMYPEAISREKRTEKLPKVRWFPWKWAGGAAAAAVIIGVFLFQQKPLSHQTADSLAEKSDKVRAMESSGGAANKSEAADAGSIKSKEQNTAGGAISKELGNTQLKEVTESPRTPSASQKPSEEAAARSQAPASAKPSAGVKTLSPSPPTTAKGIQPNPTPKPTTGTEAPKPSDSQSGAASTVQPSGNPDKNAELPEKNENSNKTPSFIAQPPLSGANPETAPTTNADAADNEKMDVLGDNHKTNGITAGSSDELESPNKTYKAKINGQHVIVLDKDGNTVAESPEWVDVKSIRLTAWEGTALKYVVVMPDGSERIQVIDFGGRKIVP